MESEPVSPILAPTTDTPVAAVMAQVQALTNGLSGPETLELSTMMATGFSTDAKLDLAQTLTDGCSTADTLDLTATLMAGVMTGFDSHLRSDSEVLTLLDSMEAVGRFTDAGRVALAADVDARSDTATRKESLAFQRGAGSGTDLITMVTRVSAREAKRRVRLGAKTRTYQMVGTTLPPRYPVVADALAAGEIGVDAAEQIVTGLSDLPVHLSPDAVDAAERGLVASATGQITPENEGLPNAGFAFPADLIRGQVQQWKALLDPDGTAPADGTMHEARSNIGFGQFRDGLYPLRGGVTPELKGIMSGIFDTYLSARSQPVPAEPGRFPTAEEQATAQADEQATAQATAQADEQADEQARIDAGEVIPGADEFEALDTRTGGEKRADILRGLFDAAARDAGTPSMGGAAPTVMVHVNAKDLLDGTGVGWADGVEAPLSIGTVDRLVCAGGTQKIVFARNGEVLHFDLKQRFFSSALRKAIIARDGGCVIPGCTSPPGWAEMHHVIPWRHGGTTNINNGVALCWYHHSTIDTAGWLIRILNGAVQIKAPTWIAPSGSWIPANQHRAHTTLSNLGQ